MSPRDTRPRETNAILNINDETMAAFKTRAKSKTAFSSSCSVA